jgi:hypothetical protein
LKRPKAFVTSASSIAQSIVGLADYYGFLGRGFRIRGSRGRLTDSLTFARLACIDYDRWMPSDAAKAERILAGQPVLGRADIFAAAAAGETEAARAMLARSPTPGSCWRTARIRTRDFSGRATCRRSPL